ncbi:MAG: hypothetical protein LC790_18455 [Actinobacteria bacterium]|nr:hypothetical protein [Actinomycetota bacterium]
MLATWNRRPPRSPLPTPANARVLEWLSYAQTMPHAAVVVCHGGHGTLVRALSSGAAVVCCPAAGDMNENAARADWAGVGVRVPRRLVAPLTVRLAVARALTDPAIAAGARRLAAWAGGHDAGARAAELVEGLAHRRRGAELRGWDSNPQPSP